MAEENARGSTPTGLWTCAAVLCCLLALLPPGHARAADPEKTRPAWIVVWGDDVGRFNSDFGYARYRQRYASVPGDPRPAPFEGAPLEYFETGRDGDPEGLDLDGDGETEDDYVACIRFSLEQPLSAPPWPHSGNYPRPFCGRFYGGYTWQVANAQPGAHQVFTEIGINPDHHWPYSDGRADDMPLKGMGDGRNPQSWHKQFLLHLWKKADFINGGDRFDVSLDGSSRLTCMFHRYWEGFNAFRFVVQDGDEFYISEESFPGLIQADRLPKTFVLNPTETRWARYRPRGPHHIEFSPEGAEFRPHAFADVRAVGWYLAKDYAEKQISHTKWYSFEAKATVSYPPEHVSSWVETAPAGGTDQVPPFHMSTTEIPYRLWKRIYRFADMPTYVLSPRYHFRRDGDVGSCRLGRRAHSQDEPVTNITLHDAAAWCNALSELEGKAPCYYTDPEFTEVFRFEELATRYEWRKEQRRHLENPVYLNWRGEPVSPFGTGGIPLPKLYVRWSADGYRLPTPAEWSAAFEGAETAAAGRGPSTRPVGSGPANALGIHDMLGNAWEPVWAWGDSFDPAAHDTALLLGGGPEYPGDPTAPGAAASPHGDTAFDGGHNIGLRVVCRDVGLPAPATGSVPETAGAHVPTDSDEAPFWLCRKGERTGAAEEAGAPRDVPDMVPLPAGTFTINPGEWHERKVSVSAFEMGRFAVTYRQWAAVRHWAEAHGYEFDRSGDLGSCYWSDGTTHAPDEPVTRVTIWDAMVFCNALSEARERRPCYYTDADRTQVLRRAFLERPPHPAPPDFGTQHAYVPWVFVDWSADGYRLPTLTESRYAARGGKEPGPFPWGSGMDDADEYIWHQWSRDADGEVSGRTHGAAETLEAKEPNGFGLYDIVGNVYELSWSTLPGNVKSRHRLEDLDNPKWSRFWSYGLPAYAHRVRGRGLSFGSSWHWGVPRLGNKTPPCCHQFGTGSRDEAFPDVGFRVVRCEAGTHPVDGKMPLRPKIVLDYDPGDYDPLESAAHRYSIQRNAVFPGPGVADGPHLEKMFATPGPVLSSPVVHDGVVYFGCRPDDAGKGGMFCALDAGTMELLWSVEVPGGVDSSACVHEGVVYFGGRNGRLYAVTAGREGGQTRWAVQVAGKPLDSSPAVAYGCVFVHEGAYGKTAGIRGFRVADGQMAYLSPCAPYGKAAACVTPNLALSTHLAGTVVRAAKLRDEMVAWTSSVPAFGRQDVVVVGDTVYGVLGGGKIGGFYEPGHIAAIDLATGEQHWRRKLEEHIGETAYCFSSPVVWDGRIFIGMDNGYMHVYDAATGQPLPWRIRVTDSGGEPAPIRTSPSVSAPNGVVYFGAGDGVLYALDGRTGEFRWTLKLSELPIKSSVWVAGDSIFVGTAEGLAKVTRRPAPRGAEP